MQGDLQAKSLHSPYKNDITLFLIHTLNVSNVFSSSFSLKKLSIRSVATVKYMTKHPPDALTIKAH